MLIIEGKFKNTVLDTQGNRILNRKDFAQVVRIHRRHQAFALNATFEGSLLFEERQGKAFEGGHVLRGVVFTDTTAVLSHDYIQHPVQGVLDAPMAAHRVQNSGGIIG